jgi:8-oxo-dGTP pyrophosphatase MutT (NUDIX family)
VEPPRVTSRRVVYENRWMRLHEDRTERADGTPGLYAWVEKPPAALIVPRDGDFVWLIEQFRHPVGGRFWEFPQGAWEDQPGAAPEDLARGELAEETGLRAGRIEHVGRLFFAYGLTDQSFDVWVASDLSVGEQALEATEADLRVGRFSAGAFEAMIERGEVRDAASVAAWHLAVRWDRRTAAG